jgi:hypothetical protein
MSTISSGTRFIGIAPSVNLTERKSALINNETEPFTIEDIADTVSGGGIYANGFTSVGPILADITLPQGGTFNYPSPLIMGLGFTLTIPLGTTLHVI